MDKWWIQPDNQAAYSRVLQFNDSLNSSSSTKLHPLLCCTFKEQQEFKKEESFITALEPWTTPNVQSLLRVDIEKDLDPEQDRDRIYFLRKVRTTFAYYIRLTIQSGSLTLREFLQLFEMMHRFKVLFDMGQYGMTTFWNSMIKKSIVIVYFGTYELLLFLFEWIPHMFTKEHYLMCTGLVQGEEFQTRMREACELSPLLAHLFEKHRDKFELYF